MKFDAKLCQSALIVLLHPAQSGQDPNTGPIKRPSPNLYVYLYDLSGGDFDCLKVLRSVEKCNDIIVQLLLFADKDSRIKGAQPVPGGLSVAMRHDYSVLLSVFLSAWELL